MNKFKEKRRLENVVANQVTNDTKLKNTMDEGYSSYQEYSIEQIQKTNYILRKVTQRSKNLKWFFWRLEQWIWNMAVLICRHLVLKQAHSVEVILQ